jgi:PKD repeat protein
MKKLLASLFLLTLLPSLTFALTRDEILTEIGRLMAVADALRAQMRSLGIDPSTVTVNTTTTPVGTPRYTPNTSSCGSVTRTLSVGSTGSDVSAIQSILSKKGFLNSLPTGYYGTLTAQAVSQFQISQGLTPSGITDSRTAERIMYLCTGGTVAGVAPVDRASLTVNPTFGSAPLQVSAVFAINGTTCTSYALDWGDGSSPVSREGGFSGCVTDNINRQMSHTYQSRGTYTITLRTIRGALSSAPVVQQTTVTVQ